MLTVQVRLDDLLVWRKQLQAMTSDEVILGRPGSAVARSARDIVQGINKVINDM